MSKTLEQMMDDMQNEVLEVAITPDEFEHWRSLRCTKRLLLEISHGVLGTVTDCLEQELENCEKTSLHMAYAKGMKESLELVLSWVPVEIESDDR